MISPFLSKLLTTRQASFTEDEIEIFELKFNMQPLMSLVQFQNEMEDKELMKRFGYLISESIISHFKKRYALEGKKIVNLWTNLFNIGGFGKIEVVNLSNDVGILQIKNSNFAKLYRAKFGVQKEPICHMIRGIIENLFETTTGKKVECIETTCIATSKGLCTFEVRTIQ